MVVAVLGLESLELEPQVAVREVAFQHGLLVRLQFELLQERLEQERHHERELHLELAPLLLHPCHGKRPRRS